MTNYQQQIEAWREQFERYHGAHSRFDNGRYVEQMDQTLWVCWVAAKRNQPVVELPDPDHYYLDDDVYDADQVHAAITAAGYSYRVAK